MPTPPAHWGAPGQPVFVGRRSERAAAGPGLGRGPAAIRPVRPGLRRGRALGSRGWSPRQPTTSTGAGPPSWRRVQSPTSAVRTTQWPSRFGFCSPGPPRDTIQLGDEVATQAEVVDRLRRGCGRRERTPQFRRLDCCSTPSAGLWSRPPGLIRSSSSSRTCTGRPRRGPGSSSTWPRQSTDVPLLVLATLRTHRFDGGRAAGARLASTGWRACTGWTSIRCRPTTSPTTSTVATASPRRRRRPCPGAARTDRRQPVPATRSVPFMAAGWRARAVTPRHLRRFGRPCWPGAPTRAPGSLEVLRLAAVLGQQVSAAELGWCLRRTDHRARPAPGYPTRSPGPAERSRAAAVACCPGSTTRSARASSRRCRPATGRTGFSTL